MFTPHPLSIALVIVAVSLTRTLTREYFAYLKKLPKISFAFLGFHEAHLTLPLSIALVNKWIGWLSMTPNHLQYVPLALQTSGQSQAHRDGTYQIPHNINSILERI